MLGTIKSIRINSIDVHRVRDMIDIFLVLLTILAPHYVIFSIFCSVVQLIPVLFRIFGRSDCWFQYIRALAVKVLSAATAVLINCSIL